MLFWNIYFLSMVKEKEYLNFISTERRKQRKWGKSFWKEKSLNNPQTKCFREREREREPKALVYFMINCLCFDKWHDCFHGFLLHPKGIVVSRHLLKTFSSYKYIYFLLKALFLVLSVFLFLPLYIHFCVEDV